MFPQAETGSAVFFHHLFCDNPVDRFCPFPWVEQRVGARSRWGQAGESFRIHVNVCAPQSTLCRLPGIFRGRQPNTDVTTALFVLGTGLRLPFSFSRFSFYFMYFWFPWLKDFPISYCCLWDNTPNVTGKVSYLTILLHFFFFFFLVPLLPPHSGLTLGTAPAWLWASRMNGGICLRKLLILLLVNIAKCRTAKHLEETHNICYKRILRT